mmetsp:Transcript_53127/g.78765  ORF Transcript_53127/g.78765 Transcript_53127/m.78765 type:complete len:252 (+) Transcript_53127:4057-4812(+)
MAVQSAASDSRAHSNAALLWTPVVTGTTIRVLRSTLSFASEALVRFTASTQTSGLIVMGTACGSTTALAIAVDRKWKIHVAFAAVLARAPIVNTIALVSVMVPHTPTCVESAMAAVSLWTATASAAVRVSTTRAESVKATAQLAADAWTPLLVIMIQMPWCPTTRALGPTMMHWTATATASATTIALVTVEEALLLITAICATAAMLLWRATAPALDILKMMRVAFAVVTAATALVARTQQHATTTLMPSF